MEVSPAPLSKPIMGYNLLLSKSYKPFILSILEHLALRTNPLRDVREDLPNSLHLLESKQVSSAGLRMQG